MRPAHRLRSPFGCLGAGWTLGCLLGLAWLGVGCVSGTAITGSNATDATSSTPAGSASGGTQAGTDTNANATDSPAGNGNAAGNATAAAAAAAANDLFVRRQGSTLSLQGKPFRFSGCNIYWMAGRDRQQVREALATAKAMGARVVRANSLGTYLGTSSSLEPQLNVFNPNGFATIDYAIATAAKYGLKLQIPFTDNYDYGGQGKYQFLRWRNLTDGNAFYTDPNVIADFKAYIKNYICHVNTITGVRYRDDPTIAIWETGNEFGGYMFREGVPPAAFTKTIADYIKSLDANHLVMDGSDGINPNALSIPSVDIYSDHFYPPDLSLYQNDEDLVVGAGKVLVIGEWDWTGSNGGASLASFLSKMETGKAAGDAWWSLFVHNGDCQGYEQHNDGYTLHWPGDTNDMVTRAEQLRQHAYVMAGVQAPAKPTVACPTPEP